MKIIIAVIIECVGPRCISDLSRKPKIMSMSGITERVRINGTLKFTLNSLADALASRYASDMCPTANEAFFLLENETAVQLIIKSIGYVGL